jgi:hypothetical protein
LTITDSTHTDEIEILNGKNGENGTNGVDGLSPSITATQTENGYILEITDSTHTDEIEILNGKDGKIENIDLSGYVTTDSLTEFEDETKYSMQTQNEKILNLEVQLQDILSLISGENSDVSVQSTVLFDSENTPITTYSELIYACFNGNLKPFSEFASSYFNFCNEADDYSIYINQSDFGWSGTVYLLFLSPIKITDSSQILLTYISNATAETSLYLVPKSELSGAELAQYIYDSIKTEKAIEMVYKWLYSDTYISVLQSLDVDLNGEYYLVLKGVSDNSHPKISEVKVLECR